MTRIFDAHCDSVLRIADAGVDLARRLDDGHLDVPRLREGGVGCQVFACFGTRAEHGDGIAAHADHLLDLVARLDLIPEVTFPRTAAELEALGAADERVGILLAVEGGEALDGRVDRLDGFRERGVRYITLAWNDNELTGSSFGGGGGLTGLGVDVVRGMEERGILVDVSHMSDEAFADTARIARRPFIASHSSCRALCQIDRNLTDDQIRVLAERGGVIGVMYAPGVLDEGFRATEGRVAAPIFEEAKAHPERIKEILGRVAVAMANEARPGLDSIVDHLEHLVEVGGLDCAALGSDFDGLPYLPAGLDDCTALPDLVARMAARGFSAAQIERICWGNWLRVFRTTFEE